MSETETSTAVPRAIMRESKIAAELESHMARIRQQIDDVTAGTIANITAPASESAVIAPPMEQVSAMEPPTPPVEAVETEPMTETASAIPVETRRKFEAYGKSIASALSGFPMRLGGVRKLAS